MQKYLVGGAVRDELLSLPVHECDWVVVGSTAEAMLQQGYRQVGKDFPVFLHPDTNEEYALARTERKSGSGHCGFEVFSSPDTTLEEDLLRRDLTINAIAKDKNDVLIDPYHGQKDIQNRILRHVSPAFSEDPLRVLRVARFAARFWSLGFTIAPDTLALMASITASGELELLSKERIWQETKRALECDHPEIFFLILLQIHALDHLAPDLASALNKKSALLHLAMLRNIHSAQHRYACLLLLASETNGEFNYQLAENISQSFSRTNAYQEVALLTVKYFKSCCDCLQSSSEHIYDTLRSLDVFRREERYVELIECMLSAQTIFNSCKKNALVFMRHIAHDINAVSIDGKERKDLSGKQIGEKIKDLRLQEITKQLAATR